VLNPCYHHSSDFWHTVLQHGYRISALTDRLARLRPRPARSVRPWDPKRYAAVYPEIVKTMVLFASPYWRQLATSGCEEDHLAFHDEFTRRLPDESGARSRRPPTPDHIDGRRAV
jgi:hypothetical protein